MKISFKLLIKQSSFIRYLAKLVLKKSIIVLIIQNVNTFKSINSLEFLQCIGKQILL